MNAKIFEKDIENFDDIIGQNHLKFLFNKIIEIKNIGSFIFYGESGIGKTSVANLLARKMAFKFDTFNASIGQKEELISKLKENKVLIIDEIHRLNKDKQDILLTFLENQEIIIFATTTENPYFKINPAIRSRMQILQFLKPTKEDILSYFESLFKKENIEIDKNIVEKIIYFSNFDIRKIKLNFSLLMKISNDKNIDQDLIKKVIPNINFYSDKNSDAHYNNLSAFHKSLRGSDVDASLYYGYLIIKSGDFDGLYRRITAVAYEDIGLANSIISLKVEAAIQAAERLGMPEAKLPLSQIIVELALSPKSNSTYLAFNEVKKIIDDGYIFDMPNHLKDAHYKNAKNLNHGINYKYPHNFKNNFVNQQYLPNELKDKVFFHFGNNKNEEKIKSY